MQKKLLFLMITFISMNTYVHCAEQHAKKQESFSQIKTLLQEMVAAAKRQKYNNSILTCCRPAKTIKAEDIDIHKYFKFNVAKENHLLIRNFGTPQLRFMNGIVGASDRLTSIEMVGCSIQSKKKYESLITQGRLMQDNRFKTTVQLSDKEIDMYLRRPVSIFYIHQVQKINGAPFSDSLFDAHADGALTSDIWQKLCYCDAIKETGILAGIGPVIEIIADYC